MPFYTRTLGCSKVHFELSSSWYGFYCVCCYIGVGENEKQRGRCGVGLGPKQVHESEVHYAGDVSELR